MTYSHNDHFKFAVADGKYQVSYGRSAHQPDSFRAEVRNAAYEIGLAAKASNLPVYVYMSGGQDSEVMARGFLEACVPFTPVLIRFENERNMHDIGHAIKFCERYGLRPKIVDHSVRRT